MTAALPPPSRPQPSSSKGQLGSAAAVTTRPAPSAPLRWAAASPARRPLRSMTRVTATAPTPEPSTSTASGSPAAAWLPVISVASSEPAVPPAARPSAPSSWAAIRTRTVRRCNAANPARSRASPSAMRGSGVRSVGEQSLTATVPPRTTYRTVAAFSRRPERVQHRFEVDSLGWCVNLERGPGGRRCPAVTVELDLRLLRHFVAVAEELHFTHAAAKLYLTEQALSRDIRRLEEQLGLTLFTRTTRRVTLTPDGQRLLVRGRELLALHDRTVLEMHNADRPLLVDLLAEGHTPVRVLRRARDRAPRSELVARFHGGMGVSLRLLLAGQLDVAFGRTEGLGRAFPSEQLLRRPVRLEPLAVLLPAAHPLAELDAVPLSTLRGTQVDASAGNESAPEWVDLAVPMLPGIGAEPSPPHLHAAGLDETVRHLHDHGLPILTLAERLV